MSRTCNSPWRNATRLGWLSFALIEMVSAASALASQSVYPQMTLAADPDGDALYRAVVATIQVNPHVPFSLHRTAGAVQVDKTPLNITGLRPAAFGDWDDTP